MSASLATVAYIGAAILFILSLGGLSNPETSRRGNLLGMVGMALAVLATVFGPRVGATGIAWIVAALVITWVIIFFLACDGLLTGAAMLRYTDRQNNPEPKNVAEAFLDNTYDDDWMEHHWPNMVVTKDAE